MSTFSYVKYTEESTKKSEEIKAICEQLEVKIKELGPGRYQALALTNLETAFAFCGKAIRDLQMSTGEQSAHVPERSSE